MILENLKDFEWYNEPENVIFTDKEIKIVAKKLLLKTMQNFIFDFFGVGFYF